jgi:hypothetical protein
VLQRAKVRSHPASDERGRCCAQASSLPIRLEFPRFR